MFLNFQINCLQEVNEEWLSDRSRFSYDGLKRQRLVSPMIKNSQQQLVNCSWEEAFFRIVDKVNILSYRTLSDVLAQLTKVSEHVFV